MTRLRRIRLCVVLSGAMVLVNSVLWAAKGIIYRARTGWQVLSFEISCDQRGYAVVGLSGAEDPSESDIVDFYGPCDHDPLGRTEVLRQKLEARRWRDRIDGETN